MTSEGKQATARLALRYGAGAEMNGSVPELHM